MRTIDEKVVEMRFDNRDFERNVGQSIGTLDKLKKNLDFTNSERSFSNLSKAAGRVEFGGMAKALDTVKAKFSALEVAGITAMMRLTNAAIDTGEKLVKSLSVDQIAAGWDKFAKKTTSVGTLISQGYKIEDVNKQLERLNWFTDETSYNFTDMVDNIGKFTAAGQSLEDSVTAMEGIALWAARSGQNASTASRAMYQLSQAIGSGFMRRADYVSIQNANMDTQEFRQHALDAAVALETLKKNADGTYESLMIDDAEAFTISQFAEHLTEDLWFTSDVMMEVFRQYGQAAEVLPDFIDAMGLDTASDAIARLRDIQKSAEKQGKKFEDVVAEMGYKLDDFALSAFEAGQEARTFEDVILSVQDAVSTGWLNTFEKIFGDYTQQKVFWTDLANELWDVFAAGGEARNEALAMWGDVEGPGGRAAAFESFWNLFNAIKGTLEAIKSGWSLVLPGDAEGKLKKIVSFTEIITTNVNKFAEFLDNHSLGITRTIRVITTTVLNLKDAIGSVIGTATDLGKRFADRFEEVFPEARITKIITFFSKLSKSVKDFAANVREIVNDNSYNFDGIINGFIGAIGIGSEFISAIAKPIIDFGKQFIEGIDFKAIINLLGDYGDAVYNLYQNIKENETFDKAVQGVIDTISRLFSFIDGFIKDVTGKSIGEIFDSFITAVSNFANDLNNVDTSGIDRFVSSMVTTFDPLNKVLTAIAGVINTIKGLLKKAIEWLSPIFEKLKTLLMSFLNWVKESFINLDLNKVLDFVTSIFLFIMSGNFAMGMKWTTDLIGDIDDFIFQFDKLFKAFKFEKLARMIMEFSFAVLILATAFKQLSTIDGIGVVNASAGLAAIIGLVTAFEKILMTDSSVTANPGSTARLVKGVGSLILFAIAIKQLSKAFMDLATLDDGAINRGSFAITVLVGLVTAFEKIMMRGGVTALLENVGSLWGFAAAIETMARALVLLSSLSWEQIGVGLTGVAAIVALIGIFEKEMMSMGTKENPAQLVKGMTSLVVFALAVMMFAHTLKGLSEIPFDNIITGIIGLISIVTLIGLFIKFIQDYGLQGTKLVGPIMLLIPLATAMLLLAASFKILASMSWDQYLVGVTGMISIVAILIGFLALLDSSNIEKLAATSVSLIGIGIAMVIFAGALAILAALDIIHLSAAVLAIGVIIGEIALAMYMMPDWKTVLAGAGAIVAVSLAIAIFAPALALLASVPILGLISALGAIAAAFVIFGVAAAVLKPVAPVMLELAAASALFGLSIAALGAGLVALAAGMTAMVAAADVAIVFIKITLPQLLLAVFDMAVEIIPKVANAVVDLLLVVIVVMAKRSNEIVRELLNFLSQLLLAVAEYLPGIFESVIDIVVTTIRESYKLLREVLTTLITELITLVDEVIEAFGGIDIGKFATMMAVLGALNLLIAEITAIAAFAAAATLTLPIIGLNLSWFMTNIQTFLDGVKQVDSNVLEGSKLLAEAVLALTASSILSGLASLFGHQVSFVDFGKELEAFGPHIAKYAKSVSGINGTQVANSSRAIKMLTEAASNLPKHGGIVQWITGDTTLTDFAKEMGSFGEALVTYAENIRGLTASDIRSIEVASSATTSLVELASSLPKHDGLFQWFTGDNKLSDFAAEMIVFGEDLVKLSASSSQVSDEDVANIQRATDAAKIVADFSTTLPKHSGVVLGWFTSDNKLSDFANDLTIFGESIKATAASVSSFNEDDLANVTRATNAAKVVADFSTTLPEHKGVIASWFTSDNKLSDFANELAVFGPKLMDYAKSIRELNSNDLAKINGSSAAVKAIADIATSMPQQPGALASWFTDSSMSLSKFGEELTKFAPNLKSYSNEVKELDAEAITNSADAVTAFVNVIVGLPKTDGLKDIWEGKSDLPKFGQAMVDFAPKLKDFSDAIVGANIDQQAIYRAAKATEYMVNAASGIKPIGGFFKIFTGENTLSKFGEELVAFAPSLYSFAYNIKDIDADKVAKAASASHSLINAFNAIEPTGGIKQWFTGSVSLSAFGEGLSDFGMYFYDYYLDVAPMDLEKVISSTETISKVIDVVNNLPEVKWFWEETMSMTDVGADLKGFGEYFESFYQSIQYAPTEKVNLAITALEKFVNITHTLSELDNKVIAGFGSALGTLGQQGVFAFIDAFKHSEVTIRECGKSLVEWILSGVSSKKDGLPGEFSKIIDNISKRIIENDDKFKTLGGTMIDRFVEGIKAKTETVHTTVYKIVSNLKAYFKSNHVYDDWFSAGAYISGGLSDGIKSTKSSVIESAVTMANSALNAARYTLQIKSPSKAFYEIGSYAGQGLVNGLVDYESQVYGAGSELADYARIGLEQAVMYANDLIQNGADSQPTIRPVLDLTNIQNGVSQLYGMLGGDVGYDINGSLSLAKQAAIGFGSEKNSTLGLQDAIVQMSKLNGKNGETIYNTFNISGDNAREIADEVSRIIQQQVERRDAVWA